MTVLNDSKGVTLIELLIAMAILAILAAGIMPLSTMTYKRTKELELKQNLRVIRKALDMYKEYADKKKIFVSAASSGYPERLDNLVDGADLIDKKKTGRIKFLRRIPQDPMTEDGEWGLRSYSDPLDSETWGGQDVYDVYSKSDKQALNGTMYKNW